MLVFGYLQSKRRYYQHVSTNVRRQLSLAVGVTTSHSAQSCTLCEISGSHGGEYENDSIIGYGAV
jgi:hypothetical protein